MFPGNISGNEELTLSNEINLMISLDKEMNIKIYQKLCAELKILWTQHCLQRMQERDISRLDVKNGIATGEIIEDYPDDYPNPSCLIFGYNVNGHILHIVAGCDNINIYIIKAYYPDTKKFENDLKTRRKRWGICVCIVKIAQL